MKSHITFWTPGTKGCWTWKTFLGAFPLANCVPELETRSLLFAIACPSILYTLRAMFSRHPETIFYKSRSLVPFLLRTDPVFRPQPNPHSFTIQPEVISSSMNAFPVGEIEGNDFEFKFTGVRTSYRSVLDDDITHEWRRCQYLPIYLWIRNNV